MKLTEENGTTPLPSSQQPIASSIKAMSAHHPHYTRVVIIGFVTLLVIAGILIGYNVWKSNKEAALLKQYQLESFQASAQTAQAFFKANPPVTDKKAIAASQKTAAEFFKANAATPTTPAQLQAQYQELQALEAQGFQDWKAAQGK